MSFGKIVPTTILVAGLVVLLCLVCTSGAKADDTPPNMCKTTDGRVCNMCKTTDGRICDRKIVIGANADENPAIFIVSMIGLVTLLVIWCINGCQCTAAADPRHDARANRMPAPIFVHQPQVHGE